MVYYLGYYYHNHTVKNAMWAQSKKMEYIIAALNKENIKVNILSCAGREAKIFLTGKTETVDNGNTLTWFPDLGYHTVAGKALNRLILYLSVALKILKLSRKDTLIVYHSVDVSKLVYYLRKIRRCKLIIEVEEIYALAFPDDFVGHASEKRTIIGADGYILVNDILVSTLNVRSIPYAIVYGNYNTINRLGTTYHLDVSKIHIVYAGTFSKHQSAVFFAANAARHLPYNYEMHILGYGDTETVNELKRLIQKINSHSDCKITYHGMKSGKDYDQFLESCNIGLNPQKIGGYMDTAFPSKVLSYLSHGLNVVSSNLNSLRQSSLSDILNYCDSTEPKAIAESIIKANIYSKEIIIARINELDLKFRKDLMKMI